MGVEQFLADLPPICRTFSPRTLKNLVHQFKLNTFNQQQYKAIRYEEFRYAQVTTKRVHKSPTSTLRFIKTGTPFMVPLRYQNF